MAPTCPAVVQPRASSCSPSLPPKPRSLDRGRSCGGWKGRAGKAVACKATLQTAAVTGPAGLRPARRKAWLMQGHNKPCTAQHSTAQHSTAQHSKHQVLQSINKHYLHDLGHRARRDYGLLVGLVLPGSQVGELEDEGTSSAASN